MSPYGGDGESRDIMCDGASQWNVTTIDASPHTQVHPKMGAMTKAHKKKTRPGGLEFCSIPAVLSMSAPPKHVRRSRAAAKYSPNACGKFFARLYGQEFSLARPRAPNKAGQTRRVDESSKNCDEPTQCLTNAPHCNRLEHGRKHIA